MKWITSLLQPQRPEWGEGCAFLLLSPLLPTDQSIKKKNLIFTVLHFHRYLSRHVSEKKSSSMKVNNSLFPLPHPSGSTTINWTHFVDYKLEKKKLTCVGSVAEFLGQFEALLGLLFATVLNSRFHVCLSTCDWEEAMGLLSMLIHSFVQFSQMLSRMLWDTEGYKPMHPLGKSPSTITIYPVWLSSIWEEEWGERRGTILTVTALYSCL
jgi:hypothetical protein